MTDRLSHPAEDGSSEVLLTDHLDDVADRANDLVPNGKTTPYGSSLQGLVVKLARIHDAGKLTTWFQKYIRTDDRPRGPKHHSPLGALLAYHVLEASGYDSEECLIGYVAVASHHGKLPDVTEYVYERTVLNRRRPEQNRRLEEVIEQVDDITDNVPKLALAIIDEASEGTTTWEDFEDDIRSGDIFNRVKSNVSHRIGHNPKELSAEFYDGLLQAWSALILADKTSAAHAPKSGFGAQFPSRQTLSTYIESLSSDVSERSDLELQLNKLRGRARADVVDNARQFAADDERIATITLPTGMGKTLTGLDAAMTVRDETDRKRIIYALPFTSIIDQLVDEVTTIYDADEHGDLLTVHHHLADTVIEDPGTDEESGEDTDEYARVAEMLGESWRSGLVVSTFVQLFESLTGPKNTQSMKLPALYDCVIILDEPQSLPHDWWPLVERLVQLLTDEYDATVIAMTATQPRLFEGNVRELVEEWQNYFDKVERTEYVLHESVRSFPAEDPGPVGYDTASETIIESVRAGEDVLAVCNTIDSAQALTASTADSLDHLDVGEVYDELLREEGTNSIDGAHIATEVKRRDPTAALIHLTTRIRPRDRLALIKSVKDLTGCDVPTCVVSTQLIEAGVDVSFDHVIRDFAPVDSLVQAAGRCNRSFEQDKGTVTVWWLAAPDDRANTPAEAVYNMWGESLLQVTKQVLDSIQGDESTTIDEPTVARDAVQKYYRVLTEDRRVGRREYVEWVDDAQAGALGDLSLIDERMAIDVIVCRTQNELDKLHEIKECWNGHEFREARNLLQELRSAQISVPVYDSDSVEATTLAKLEQVHEETELRWLDATSDQYESYFEPTTGLVVPDSTIESRFL